MSGKLKLVVTNGQTQLQQCSLYAHQHAVLENHHICPESWWVHAGRVVSSPMAKLCPNCHMSIHVCIDGILSGLNISLLPPRCRKLAQAAFVIARENGLTPSRTL